MLPRHTGSQPNHSRRLCAACDSDLMISRSTRLAWSASSPCFRAHRSTERAKVCIARYDCRSPCIKPGESANDRRNRQYHRTSWSGRYRPLSEPWWHCGKLPEATRALNRQAIRALLPRRKRRTSNQQSLRSLALASARNSAQRPERKWPWRKKRDGPKSRVRVSRRRPRRRILRSQNAKSVQRA